MNCLKNTLKRKVKRIKTFEEIKNSGKVIITEKDDEGFSGDRVKFKTIGGWHNSGIIRDITTELGVDISYLIEVDKSEDPRIPLPYYARVLSSCEIAAESEGKHEL